MTIFPSPSKTNFMIVSFYRCLSFHKWLSGYNHLALHHQYFTMFCSLTRKCLKCCHVWAPHGFDETLWCSKYPSIENQSKQKNHYKRKKQYPPFMSSNKTSSKQERKWNWEFYHHIHTEKDSRGYMTCTHVLWSRILSLGIMTYSPSIQNSL